MDVMIADEEKFVEAWQNYLQEVSEYLEEAVREETKQNVQEFYEDVLLQNLEANKHLSNLPEEAQEELAEMGAKTYAKQAERILDSRHLGYEELEIAMATAFLDKKRQVKVGAQAQGLVSSYWDQMNTENNFNTEDQYRKWAVETLINPWPPHQLSDDWESVERFKPGEEDPTYQ